MQKSKKIFFIFLIFLFSLFAQSVQAAVGDMDTQLGQAAGQTGHADKNKKDTTVFKTDLYTGIGVIIGKALSFVGIIFLVLIIYGGFIWMLARGNEQEAKKAKDILQMAIIGMIIVFAAYAITNLVVSTLKP